MTSEELIKDSYYTRARGVGEPMASAKAAAMDAELLRRNTEAINKAARVFDESGERLAAYTRTLIVLTLALVVFAVLTTIFR